MKAQNRPRSFPFNHILKKVQEQREQKVHSAKILLHFMFWLAPLVIFVSLLNTKGNQLSIFWLVAPVISWLFAIGSSRLPNFLSHSFFFIYGASTGWWLGSMIKVSAAPIGAIIGVALTLFILYLMNPLQWLWYKIFQRTKNIATLWIIGALTFSLMFGTVGYLQKGQQGLVNAIYAAFILSSLLFSIRVPDAFRALWSDLKMMRQLKKRLRNEFSIRLQESDKYLFDDLVHLFDRIPNSKRQIIPSSAFQEESRFTSQVLSDQKLMEATCEILYSWIHIIKKQMTFQVLEDSENHSPHAKAYSPSYLKEMPIHTAEKSYSPEELKESYGKSHTPLTEKNTPQTRGLVQADNLPETEALASEQAQQSQGNSHQRYGSSDSYNQVNSSDSLPRLSTPPH